VEHRVRKVDITKKIGYRTSLPKYSEVLRQMSLLDEEHSGRISIIRGVLNVSDDELEETLRFLECIGAIRRRRNQCFLTNYGKTVLTRVIPDLPAENPSEV